MKTVDKRVKECVNIRKQVTMLGAMLDETSSQKISDAMNSFIKDGLGQNVVIRVNDKNSLHMKLVAKENIQSGVTLIKT